MRYTEREYKVSVESPIDGVRLISSFIFLAPYRLFNEISNKIIFIGYYNVKKVCITGLLINSGLLIGNVIMSYFSKRGIHLFAGRPPLIVLIISTLFTSCCYLLLNNINSNALTIDIDMSGAEDKSSGKLSINGLNKKKSQKTNVDIDTDEFEEISLDDEQPSSSIVFDGGNSKDLELDNTSISLDDLSLDSISCEDISNSLDDLDFDSIVSLDTAENISMVEEIEKSRVREDSLKSLNDNLKDYNFINNTITDSVKDNIVERSNETDNLDVSNEIFSWMEGD